MIKKYWEEWEVIDHAYIEKYLTTKQVAEVTLLSLGTIQKMVDDGVFKSWRTGGGHRRILASSVKAYLIKRKKEMGV
jgi:excisionase family DNA binding protein